MPHNKFLFGLIAILLVPIVAVAVEKPALDIKRNTKVYRQPPSAVDGQKIFVEFKDSQKLGQRMKDALRAGGYTVVDNASEADASFRFSGYFSVDGAGKETIKGSLGELIEKATPVDAVRPDYAHENINLTQIAASSIGMGVISVTDVVRWLSQQTGIAGRVNEALTGDTRGFCFGENCNNLRNQVRILVTGSGTWTAIGEVQNEKVVLDQIIGDTLAESIKPLMALRQPEQPSSEGRAQ